MPEEKLAGEPNSSGPGKRPVAPGGSRFLELVGRQLFLELKPNADGDLPQLSAELVGVRDGVAAAAWRVDYRNCVLVVIFPTLRIRLPPGP